MRGGTKGEERGRGGEVQRVCPQIMHFRSRMAIDPRIPEMPGWSTSGFHRPGRHWLHRYTARGMGEADRWGEGEMGERERGREIS